jgi:hypothetical protein
MVVWGPPGRHARAFDGSSNLYVNLHTELPAGTNLLGKVGIDQTTPGTMVIGDSVTASAGENGWKADWVAPVKSDTYKWRWLHSDYIHPLGDDRVILSNGKIGLLRFRLKLHN